MFKSPIDRIKNLTRVGIDHNTSEADAGRIAMCNFFNVFAISGFILFTIIISLFKWWVIVAVELLFILFFSCSVLLNKYKNYNLARMVFLFSFIGFILFFSWLDYTHTVCVYYYLFILPLMIFVLFDARQLYYIIIALSGVAATYILINEIPSPLNLHNSSIGSDDMRWMHLLNVMIIFFIISFIAFHFARMYHAMNESLITKQQQLADNHSLAKAGNWYYSRTTNSYKYSQEMNEIFEKETGEDLTGKDLFLESLSEKDKDRFIQNRSKVLDKKISIEDDYEIILRKETVKFLVAVLQPVINLKMQVRGIYGVCIDVTEERRVQLFLKEHLHEKEVMLDEIHNRIKYNLSLIADFVQLQIDSTSDQHVKEMFEVCRQRISTMSLIHEKMYSATFKTTMFDDYLRELIQNICHSIATSATKVEVITHLEPVVLKHNNVLPCGLIINELMTNSYKHAFKGRANGVITITMKTVEDHIVITYQDDGTGFKVPGESAGIGMDLIYSLTQQLKGTIVIKNQNGFYCKLSFKADKG